MEQRRNHRHDYVSFWRNNGECALLHPDKAPAIRSGRFFAPAFFCCVQAFQNEKSPRHTPWAFFSPWNLTCRINRNATPLRATLAVLRSIQE